ncbi:crossover junction endodeoxyribonuclease RuvC [bacterium]|nr:crossover junction endodeoxyribonuclease RuvC [bacterium]
MHVKNNRLLAIDPGAREMGIAVLDEFQIVYYGVKSLKMYRPQKILNRAVADILMRLIVEYGIQTIVVEDGHFSQIASSLYNAVVQTIQETANQRKLRLVLYDPKTIRQSICRDGKATKKRTAQFLSERYPELKIYLEQDRGWKAKYWMHVFDALASGLAHVMKLEEDGRK